MSTPPEQFARIRDKVNLDELARKLVVIVGVGSVGSQIAKELAYSGVERLHFIDGKSLREVNVIRHALPRKYVGESKAEALTLYLAGEIPTLQPKGLARDIDDDMSDAELDVLLEDADLIVAATDDRRAQRRIGARARALGIPAIFPGLYEDDGGEVFVQRRPSLPCFSCWDSFRGEAQALRGATALNVDILPVLFLTVELCLGLLDSDSIYFRRLVAQERGQQLPLLFRLSVRDELVLGTPRVSIRENCPVCRAGPVRSSVVFPWIGRPTPAPGANRSAGRLSAASWLALSIFSILMVGVLSLLVLNSQSSNSAPSCGSTECFDQHFLHCSPAEYSFDDNGNTIRYVIAGIGPERLNCIVQMNYLTVEGSPKMACVFNRRADFWQAAHNVEYSPAKYHCSEKTP